MSKIKKAGRIKTKDGWRPSKALTGKQADDVLEQLGLKKKRRRKSPPRRPKHGPRSSEREA